MAKAQAGSDADIDGCTPAESRGLRSTPAVEDWDNWKEYDPREWPRKVERRYTLVPTACFNCESACGLLAYVDKDSHQIRKLEGHPLHPASRGRNCAKGAATLNQLTNPDRILYPLRRAGDRGQGKWERVSWDEALEDIARRIRKAIVEERRDQVVYHVGRPGEDLYTERVLAAWGVDGHNSHTNICSSSARLGYAAWMGMDRPTPDHANAKFILLMSSHLEAGHYFVPQAQRIVESQESGAKVAVVDTRLSNTASKADYWLAPRPGTESGMLLAIANHLVQEDLYNRSFLEKWVNWRDLINDPTYLGYLVDQELLDQMPEDDSFDSFVKVLKELYKGYTFEWAEAETGVSAEQLLEVAKEVARAGAAFASHIWRNAAAGHLGGWMVPRTLLFLNVLTGSVGTPGGTLPNSWAKFVPKAFSQPPPLKNWNETHFPPEFPLAHFEMSFLLPHLLKERDRSVDVYFTRVYNPVWTNPDGFSWIDMFQHSDRIGLHVALTPVWSETAQYADYVLPMGLSPERHDLHSYESHACQWIGFRQPVVRVARERDGEQVEFTHQTNPGEVWEENEFWIELSWKIDPDGSLGIRQHFESPFRPGEKVSIGEYYRWIFENSVPGLPETAEKEGLAPLEYMKRYGAFKITDDVYNQHERSLSPEVISKADLDEYTGLVYSSSPPPPTNVRPYPGPFLDKEGKTRVGISVDGQPVQGFPTPSGKLEFYSATFAEWGWPEYAIPIYPRTPQHRERMPHITSQVHHSQIDTSRNEYVLLPTFRLPTLIHTRTNGAKWLHEIAHINPVWINPQDAERIGVGTGDLARVETEIGHFVDRVWVTEAIRPGVVACSHHLGRWRLHQDSGSDRWNSALVTIEKQETDWSLQQVHGATPFKSDDPDSERIWWSDGGVHQNLVFPVQPDPLSGGHCWHQKVRVERAGPNDKYGDISVDQNSASRVYKRWLEQTRPAPGPGGLRRPHWMLRPLKPHIDAYRFPNS